MDTTQIRTPATELLVLQQVARIVSRGDDRESRIQDILRHIAHSPGLVRGRVLLADPDAGECFIRYAHGLTPAEVERGRYRIGEGVSGRVFQTGEASLVANVHDEPGYLARAVSREALPPEQVAFLAVPIVRDHLPIGVLAAHRLRNHERTAGADLALLEVIATLVGQMLCADSQVESMTTGIAIDRRPAGSVKVRAEREANQDSANRDLLLRTAEQAYAQGRLHQAADRYLRVATQWSGSEQAGAARSRLLEIARYYEGRGANRLAQDVLDRMQRVQEEDGGDESGGRPAWRPGADPRDEDDSDPGHWPFVGALRGRHDPGRSRLWSGDH